MNRRQLFALPVALLGATESRPGVYEWAARHVARKGGLISVGSYQFKPGEGERLAAALAGVKPVGPAFITHIPIDT
jgi:hypothetical protein